MYMRLHLWDLMGRWIGACLAMMWTCRCWFLRLGSRWLPARGKNSASGCADLEVIAAAALAAAAAVAVVASNIRITTCKILFRTKNMSTYREIWLHI